MLEVNFDDLLKHLQKKGHPVEFQKETQQLVFLLKQDKREFPVFIKIYPSKWIQILTFLPCQVKSEQNASLARLLHIINREIEYPGFGMDEKAGYAFFRCMIPPLKGQIGEQTLDNFIDLTFDACKNYSPAIEAVAMGLVQLNDLLKNLEKKP